MQKARQRKTIAALLSTFNSYTAGVITMLKTIYISIVTSLAIGALLWSLMEYFTLPVVAFNQAGQCVYIDTEQGRQDCDTIPNKYIKQHIR